MFKNKTKRKAIYIETTNGSELFPLPYSSYSTLLDILINVQKFPFCSRWFCLFINGFYHFCLRDKKSLPYGTFSLGWLAHLVFCCTLANIKKNLKVKKINKTECNNLMLFIKCIFFHLLLLTYFISQLFLLQLLRQHGLKNKTFRKL